MKTQLLIRILDLVYSMSGRTTRNSVVKTSKQANKQTLCFVKSWHIWRDWVCSGWFGLRQSWHIWVKQKAAFIGEQIVGNLISLDGHAAYWLGAKHSRSFLLVSVGLLGCVWCNSVTRSALFLSFSGDYSSPHGHANLIIATFVGRCSLTFLDWRTIRESTGQFGIWLC